MRYSYSRCIRVFLDLSFLVLIYRLLRPYRIDRKISRHTVAIESPSATAFFFSLALTFAVVDKTAVVTVMTASFLGGFVMEEYANKLGPAFDIGAWDEQLAPRLYVSAIETYLEVSIQMKAVGSKAKQAQCQSAQLSNQ